MTTKTGIFIFRHDLRLADNPAFNEISERCGQLLCVFVIEDNWFKQNELGAIPLGKHRQYFLLESLRELNDSLEKHNQALHVVYGDFIQSITTMIDSHQPDFIGLNQHCGHYEISNTNQLRDLCYQNQIEFINPPEPSLLEITALPFGINEMPDVFSPFRRKVEKTDCKRKPLEIIKAIPKVVSPFDYHFNTTALEAGYDEYRAALPDYWQRMHGGESSAGNQLDYYLFDTDLIANYKQTRNQLQGWDFSSKLSAWLANGSISPATVAAKISQYETSRVANDSTYWLIFELLWREFFHLQTNKHGPRLFDYGGIQQRQPTTHFDPNVFEQWCNGNTGFKIVDACMRQLNATGFISNRGRQLVASCFVHELNLDWRYGAAYFEQQLVDYDVASNWGNWQYLAGVGSDPRGHRQFNLNRQTEIYDPMGEFINHWLNEARLNHSQ